MKSSGHIAPALIAIAAAIVATPAHSGIISFEDLANGPSVSTPALPLNQAVSPQVGGNATYDGIVWDSRLSVAHSSYRLDPSGPQFGLPHTGNVYLTGAADQILITTTQVLTEAWFGRNQYYGFSNGTDQVTVNALHGSTVLASVTYNLPLTDPGQPEPLTRVDTSSFLGLSGITGYRIDRDEVDPTFGENNWIADDFNFVSVPETGSLGMLAAAALGGFGLVRRFRR